MRKLRIKTPRFACVEPTGGGEQPGGDVLPPTAPPVIDLLTPGYAHPTVGVPSYACVEVTGTPGAQVTVGVTGPAEAFDNPAPPPTRTDSASKVVTLPVGGKITAMFEIYKLGDYNFTATASNANGTSAPKNASTTVASGPAGTVVGPPDCGTG